MAESDATVAILQPEALAKALAVGSAPGLITPNMVHVRRWYSSTRIPPVPWRNTACERRCQQVAGLTLGVGMHGQQEWVFS